MSFIKNKKGISEVISVVMIIMLTVSAAAIVFATVRSSISQLSPGIDCTTHTISNTLSVKYACYDKELNRIELTIKRNINEDSISRADFKILGEGSSEELICGNTCGGCNLLSPGETKNYYLEELKIKNPESVVLSVDGCTLEKTTIRPC
ncbi:hypothetical protein AUJ84_00805 [Candidatus Pacearchaeota archaeon CG1_02_32_132]|nr:MAG: hypothetical protein AUJ84_00805 [Candidatus Pacearchaeota archaeon CG1_02_32_132]